MLLALKYSASLMLTSMRRFVNETKLEMQMEDLFVV